MSEPDVLAPLLRVLSDLVDWLQAEQAPGVVIGGVAASILGRPRLTADVDVVVLVDDAIWPRFAASGERFGFVPRHNDALDFARQSRVLLLRHDPSAINVDIVFAALLFEEEAIARAQSVTVRGLALPLPTVEDLVIMKAIAHRSRDMADIAALLESHPRLDRRRILRWVREFSAALDMPDVLGDVQVLLRRHRA